MIRVFVLDTNCLISAHIFKSSVSRNAFELALEKGMLVHSTSTLEEFRETILRPKFDKYVAHMSRGAAVTAFGHRSFHIEVDVRIDECRDKKDNKFLELAVTIGADCIVSGDKDLLVMHPFRNIPILNAGDFLKRFQ